MTIIAYKNGVMSCDTSIWEGDTLIGHAPKIVRRRDGILIGAAGSVRFAQTAMTELLRAEDILKDEIDIDYDEDENSTLIAMPNGQFICHHVVAGSYPSLYDAPYASTGSGADLALGAMGAGATSWKAVAIAIQHCSSCRGDILSLSHDSPKFIKRNADQVLRELYK